MAKIINRINEDIANLVKSDIDKEDMKALREYQKVDKIKVLNLSWNQISQTQILQFSKGHWKNLETIYLHNNLMGDLGCKILSRTTIAKFSTLDLRYNQIGSNGMLHLSKGRWKSLKDLNLQVNVIGDAGLRWIVSSNWNINNLSLRWNRITMKQTLNLMISKWKEWKSIGLSNNQIEKETNQYLNKILNQKSSIVKSSKVKFEIKL